MDNLLAVTLAALILTPTLPSGTYAYDALGRRIQKNVTGVMTRYVYDEEDIVLEYDGANVLQARYTHGPGVDEPWLVERDLDRSVFTVAGVRSSRV